MIKTDDRSRLLLFGQETERLVFRKPEEQDFDTWLQFCEDPDSTKYLGFAPEDSGIEKCRQWFDKIDWRSENQMGGMNVLVHKESGELVGQCGLLVQTVDDQEELEIGYSLMPQARGFGYALEAAVKCRDTAFGNQLADYLISIIDIENTASQQVALKNGMKIWKQTVYKNMPVYIFRITEAEWKNKITK